MADELRCKRCGGPITLRAGQRIRGPSATITAGEGFGQLRVNDDALCGDCVDALEHRDRAENGPLILLGDQLQSAASRLAEWALDVTGPGDLVPYEVRMAAHEAQSCVEEWTRRRREAWRQSAG